MADYIKHRARLLLTYKLAIFTTIEISLPYLCYPNPPCQLLCGKRPGRLLTNSFHMSGALSSSNIEKVLTENRIRSLRGERRAL